MALATTSSSRWVLIALFLVVIVMIAFGQLMFFKPTKNAVTGTFDLQQEVVHLRLENSELKEKNEEFQKTNGEKEVEVEKYKQKIEELQKYSNNNNNNTTTNNNGAVAATTADAALLEIIKTPTNVITDKDKLMYLLDTYNQFSQIRNQDKFQLEEGYIPIVIRVYKNHEYFSFALENYRKVKDISKTLMIISHDGIFPEMFKLVEKIDFCQVKQLIFPYSGHILTNRFPGPDLTIPDERDQYNNTRPFPFTGIKHHYWWHLNYVWDALLPHHNGDILWMEDDHIPTTDYYVSAKALARIRDEKCPECYNAKVHAHKHQDKNVHGVVVTHDPGNVGMILKRNMWEKLRAVGDLFCNFDDYNWDWTIIHMQTKGVLPPLTLTFSFPRAEHFGKCGTHIKSGSCEINDEDRKHFEEVNKVVTEQNGGDWEKYDYNPNPIDPKQNHVKGWGGWAHSLDKKLCMDSIVKKT